jgi:hypothetical protein
LCVSGETERDNVESVALFAMMQAMRTGSVCRSVCRGAPGRSVNYRVYVLCMSLPLVGSCVAVARAAGRVSCPRSHPPRAGGSTPRTVASPSVAACASVSHSVGRGFSIAGARAVPCELRTVNSKKISSLTVVLRKKNQPFMRIVYSVIIENKRRRTQRWTWSVERYSDTRQQLSRLSWRW